MQLQLCMIHTLVLASCHRALIRVQRELFVCVFAIIEICLIVLIFARASSEYIMR